MTLQNRVTPEGRLEAVEARGAWMGNRGVLHNDDKEITIQWKHKNWVICQLQYNGRKRTIFGKGTYSELFFLDEATALAAGHRPCGTCRREQYRIFRELWIKANADLLEGKKPEIKEIDKVLHRERADKGWRKVTYSAELASLPCGTFISFEGGVYLKWDGRLYPWTHYGYETSVPLEVGLVDVLTPASIVEVYRLGYKPEVHASALQSKTDEAQSVD